MAVVQDAICHSEQPGHAVSKQFIQTFAAIASCQTSSLALTIFEMAIHLVDQAFLLMAPNDESDQLCPIRGNSCAIR
jgi:hypothetical protein